MGSPLLPLSLALAAAAADGGGLHRAAFYLVLLAIPPAAAAALAAAGDLAEGRPTGLRAVCSAAGLALLIISSAVRANATHGLPPVALSALVGCVGAYALLGVAMLVWTPSPTTSRS
jgi:hypothetical protein